MSNNISETNGSKNRAYSQPEMKIIKGDFVVTGFELRYLDRYTVFLKPGDGDEEIMATLLQCNLFEDDADIPKTPEAIAQYMSRGLIHVTMLVKTTKTKTERLVTAWAPIDED